MSICPRRADAVVDFLKSQGVPAALITTTGLGQAHPEAPNDTPQGRAKNRRVEIDIVEAPA
jgi:outer membrane protein OmpA-like peptidoglycan-associated protein